jgi:hypothetical protein
MDTNAEVSDTKVDDLSLRLEPAGQLNPSIFLAELDCILDQIE